MNLICVMESFCMEINQLISENYVVLCNTRSDAVKIDRSMLAKQK